MFSAGFSRWGRAGGGRWGGAAAVRPRCVAAAPPHSPKKERGPDFWSGPFREQIRCGAAASRLLAHTVHCAAHPNNAFSLSAPTLPASPQNWGQPAPGPRCLWQGRAASQLNPVGPGCVPAVGRRRRSGALPRPCHLANRLGRHLPWVPLRETALRPKGLHIPTADMKPHLPSVTCPPSGIPCPSQPLKREMEPGRAAVPNDPSSATQPTRTCDCNREAMAGFAAAHA